MEKRSVAVIGYDGRAAGIAEPAGAIIEALHGRMPPGVDLTVLTGGSSDLARAWQGYDTVIVTDRLTPAGSPGAVRVWDVREVTAESAARFRDLVGPVVADAVEQGRGQSSLPPILLIVGVEGHPGGCGVGICPDVADGVRDAADWVLMQLAVRMAA